MGLPHAGFVPEGLEAVFRLTFAAPALAGPMCDGGTVDVQSQDRGRLQQCGLNVTQLFMRNGNRLTE